MSLFREIPPTAGFPIDARDFFSVGKPGSLEDDFKDYLGAPYAAVTYSGTAACYFILESLKLLSPKTTVIIPSFICPLVPLAVKRAGLRVEVCDVKPGRFDYRPEELERLCRDNPDVLAIIAVHLAGIPVDLDGVSTLTKKYGIFLIEDCAQALGAEYRGKKVGTFGDFAFFSLCRGKGLTIYEGGVVVASEQKFILAIEKVLSLLEKKDVFSEGLKILELFGYWIFYRPLLFWFVFKLPQVFWQKRGDPVRAMGEYADAHFPTHKVSTFRKALGHVFFYHLEGAISRQRRKALRYFERLDGVRGVRIVKELPFTQAVYPYVTLIMDDVEKREELLMVLNAEGRGASVIYVHAIGDYDYLQPVIPARECPNGRYLAEHTLTLSTSRFLKKKTISQTIETFCRINSE